MIASWRGRLALAHWAFSSYGWGLRRRNGTQEGLALAEDRQQLSALKDKAEGIEGALAALKEQSASWQAVPVDASFDHRLRQAQELDQLVADLEDHCAEDQEALSPLADLNPDAFLQEHARCARI